jgi:hypothetical protein
MNYCITDERGLDVQLKGYSRAMMNQHVIGEWVKLLF